MSDAEVTDSQADSPKVGKFSPFAGCLIMVIVGLLIAGIIVYSWQSYKQVQATVHGFTEKAPAELAIMDVSDRGAEQKALSEKLKGFKTLVDKKQAGSLSLNADELNLAVATYEILEPNRGQISVTSISESGVEAAISYPVKAGFSSDEKLYLNGVITMLPEVTKGSLFPTVKSVRTARGDDIPQEFKKFISESMLHPVRNDEELGALLQRIARVELVGEEILLHVDPDYVAEGALPDDTQPIINRFMKGFGIVAIVFLFIVSIIIFLARRKAKTTI